MSCLDFLEDVTKGAIAGVAVVTALPIMGAVGTITATGVVVGSSVGALLGAIDSVDNEENED